MRDANVAPKKKKKKQKQGKPGCSPAPGGNGNIPNQINPRTGYRNRCYGCGSEFRLLPHCPGKQPQAARKASIVMDTSTQDVREGQEGNAYSNLLGSGSADGGVGGSSRVILETGASANLVGESWLNNHNAILKASGRPQAKITQSFASFRYGGGRVGDARRAAMIPIAIAGHTGHFMAYVVDGKIPALLGKEALETLGSHLNFCERVLTLKSLWGGYPL